MTTPHTKHKDHSHCWEQKQPPACGIDVNHLICCLCGEPNPNRLSREQFVEQFKKDMIFDEAISSAELSMPHTNEELRENIENKKMKDLFIEAQLDAVHNGQRNPDKGDCILKSYDKEIDAIAFASTKQLLDELLADVGVRLAEAQSTYREFGIQAQEGEIRAILDIRTLLQSRRDGLDNEKMV